MSWLYADVLFGSAEVMFAPNFKFGASGKLRLFDSNVRMRNLRRNVQGTRAIRSGPRFRVFQVNQNQRYMYSRPDRGSAE